MSRSTRSFLLRLSFACLAVVCYAAPALAQCCRGNVLPTARELSRIGLEQSWWSQSTIDSQSDVLVHLTADEDAVFAQSRTGIVTAFDGETGERMWARLLGTPNAPSYPVTTNDDQVLIAAGMNLYAIDKRTGQQMWELNLPHHPSTAPGVDDTQAYIGSLDGSAYAFDLAKIRELYQDQRLPEWSNVAQNWRYTTGAELTSPPVSSGRNVNFTSLDGSLYSISKGDGSLTFQFETNGPIRTPVGRNHDSLFIASEDVRFFCININNGRLRWTFVPGLPIRKQPRVVAESVYIAPERGGIYSLSVDSGLINWHQSRATTFLTATDDRVYASDELRNILVLSRDDGAIISSLPLRCMNVFVDNDRTDRLFLATDSGVVLALKEADSEFPRYHKFPERQPILPPMGPEPEVPADVPSDADAVPVAPEDAAPQEGAAPVAPEGAAPVAPEGAAPVAPEAGFDF